MAPVAHDRIYLSSPHMGSSEFDFIREAFETNWIAPVGPHVDAFEREFADYVGSKHAVAVTSGTAALHLALRLSGVGEGDDVMVSTLTFCASVNPILYQGARPIFIDSEEQSWNLDPNLLEDELKRRANVDKLPKALVLVHLYGQCADLNAIVALCEQYGVELIEDAAEALGARYWGEREEREERGDGEAEESGGRSSHPPILPSSHPPILPTSHPPILPYSRPPILPPSQPPIPPSSIPPSSIRRSPGVYGKAGIFSFNGNKIITTSGGGMLVTDDAELAQHARKLATQARDAAPHYEHSEIGYNYRMSNVLAGIGRGQLRVLEERVEARRANFARYVERLGDLPGIAFMPEAPWGLHTRWLTCLTIDPSGFGATREDVRLALEAENIEARPVWKPMHVQPVYDGYESVGGGVSERLFAHGLCLPSGSNLTSEQVDRVLSAVLEVHASAADGSVVAVADHGLE